MNYSFKALLFVMGGSVVLSACSLFGGGGGKPTAQNPGQLSTATGLAYNDEDAGGFMVNAYEGQPDAPNMVFIEGGRLAWVRLKKIVSRIGETSKKPFKGPPFTWI